MSVAPNSRASFCRDSCRLIAMMRWRPSASPRARQAVRPRRHRQRSPSRLAFTLAASAANQPVPMTSERAKARDHVGIRDVASRDERGVREGHAQVRRLRANNRFEALQDVLITVSAVRARVVRREERADHELPRLHRRDVAPDLLDEPGRYSWPIAAGDDTVDAAVRPQVRPANARERQPNDGVVGSRMVGSGTIFKPDVTRAVKNSCGFIVISAVVSEGSVCLKNSKLVPVHPENFNFC